MLRRVALLLLVANLVACAPTRLGTPSGKPDIEIPGASRAQLRDVVVATLVGDGWTVKSANEYAVVAEKEGGMLEHILMGSRFNPITVRRITCNFIDGSGGARVVGSIGVVSNPGSGFERYSDMTSSKWGVEMQGMLQSIRSAFAQQSSAAAAPAPGASPVAAAPANTARTRVVQQSAMSPAQDNGEWERAVVARSGPVAGLDAGTRVRVSAPRLSKAPIEGVVVGWKADTMFVGHVEGAAVWTIPMNAIDKVATAQPSTSWIDVPLAEPKKRGMFRRP